MSGMQELCEVIYAKFQSQLSRIVTRTENIVSNTQYAQEQLNNLEPHIRAAVLQSAFAKNAPFDNLLRRAAMRVERFE